MAEPLEQEWRTFELYEKIRLQERRKKILIFSFVLILFLFLCSLPVSEERIPKWRSLRAAQQISIEIEKLKTRAIHEKKAMQIVFTDTASYRVELLDTCRDGKILKSEEKNWDSQNDELRILSPSEAKEFGLSLSVNQLCFDSVYGLEGETKRAIVIAPVKDLSEQRLDRASYIILESDSARISIN